MIRKYFMLREPEGGTSTPKAITTKTGNVANVRQPDEAEMATEFTADEDVLGKDVTELTTPKEPEKKEEKKEEKKVVEKKVEFTAKVEVPAKKEEEKQTAKIEPKEEVKPVVPKGPQLISPLGATKPTGQQRDYTGFSDEEARHLKAMSNEAFEYTTKLIKESKELGKLKYAQFVQHPKAYTLDPQYEQLQTDVNFLQKEADYWQTQLIQAVEGKDWVPITGWDKQGNPILGAPQKSTALATEQLRMAVNNCMNGAQNGKQQLQQFTQNYQQRINQDNQAIQQICAQYFGWCADPKQLDMTVNTGEKEETVKQIRERLIELFPPYHRNTVGVDVAANMFVALQIYGQRIRELENGKHVAEVKAEEVLRAEPLGNRTGEQLKAINGITEFDMEGLPT